MENLRLSLIEATRIPRSQKEGSTYVRLGSELKERADRKAAGDRVPGGTSGAIRKLVEKWTAGEIDLELDGE